MADAFVSYASEDRQIAEILARALEAESITVWWDRDIHGGANFAAEIEREITAARLVIVLWSASSVASNWVRDEAGFARDAGKLMPLCVDCTAAPLGFRQVQSLDFEGWRGDVHAAPFRRLLDSMRRLGLEPGAARPAAPPADAPAERAIPEAAGKSRGSRRRILAGVGAIAALVSVGIGVLLVANLAPEADAARTSPRISIADFEPLSPDDETTRFAAGLGNAIERVFSTNGVPTVSAADAGANPGSGRVGLLLQGTIDDDEETFFVTADLLDAGEGLVLWSTKLSRARSEARLLQEQLAVWLADVLRCSLRHRSRMNNDTSAELFARVLRLCEAERGDGSQYGQMPELARKVLELAPQYAESHAQYANTHAFAARQQAGVPVESQRLSAIARASAERALQMEPDNATARWALAVRPDPAVGFAERERLLREALDLDPEFLWSRNHLGHLLANVGRSHEAVLFYNRFASDYPLERTQRARAIAFEANYTRELGRARSELSKLIELWPEARLIVYFWFQLEHWLGDPVKARELAGQFAGASQQGDAVLCLEGFLGARERGQTLSEAALRASCAAGGYAGFRPERFHAYFGQVDAAYRWIEQAMENPTGRYWALTGSGLFALAELFGPEMASVRRDVRFMPLAARLGLVDYWLETDQWPDFCTTENLPYDCREAAVAARAALAGGSQKGTTAPR